MEGAVLSSPSNSRFRTHLKNAASALCARTLPKQRHNDAGASSTARHHTYPRATPPKRAAISCRMEAPICSPQSQQATFQSPDAFNNDVKDIQAQNKLKGGGTLKGTLAREVANAWGCRVGRPEEAAPADRVQSLFNDIELYPTKTQVFEMLVCARQCARRKSLTLTFGEFCVFAAELRKCSRQTRHTPTKPDSPLWNTDRENRDKDSTGKHVNGSEVPPPACEVFLGGSCNPTTWRSDIAIPMLKKMGITYFNPQVETWSVELMEQEYRAKIAARALLFVMDSETRAVAAAVEAAHIAAAPRDQNLLLVLRPYSRHQTISNETIGDEEYVELSRARATLQEAVERRGLPVFTDIPAALRCARAVLRGARTNPRHSLGHTILRLKRAFDAAGDRNPRLPRSRAVDALRDVTRVPREVADRCLATNLDTVDFETFCAAVAELAADAGRGEEYSGGMAARLRRAFRSFCDRFSSSEYQSRSLDAEAGAVASAGAEADERPARDTNGRHAYNARLRAYGRKLGLYIPKNNASRTEGDAGAESGAAGAGAGAVGTGGMSSASSGDSVFTPGTERRLDRLPALLGAPTHDVYLGGAFPSNQTRPEEILRREGYSYVIPRANDYTRMFSTGARRQAQPHPESPRHDKKPRPSAEDVQLRDKSVAVEPVDRLSASDFYTVSEDVTPQPFKGTYDEDLLLGSRMLVFGLHAESPCFASMVLAAHYMGLRPQNTVIVVQPMHPPAARTHQYSEVAVRDYNRGRHYLRDLADRSGVAVFDNIDDAMSCVIERLRNTS